MGVAGTFDKELLVIGVLYSKEGKEVLARSKLESLYGAMLEISEKEEFLWTDYYHSEMGIPIFRRYLLFANLVDPSRLARIKLETNEIESMLAENGKRSVNLDPGMLGLGRFCLATTKDRSHRIPLTDGIFSELTLIFEKGQFHALQWTYPDWASDPVKEMLARWRKKICKAVAR